MERHQTLEAGDLTLRRLGEGDLPALLEVLCDPTVARWWGEYDLARVEAEYANPDDAVKFLIEVGGAVGGMIQYGEEDDPDYRSASIDIALTEPFQGRGIGPQAIRLLARYLFGECGHHRLTIDPATTNRNAIAAYESVGFRAVGVMRDYERGPDGTWHDNLLLELLADELPD